MARSKKAAKGSVKVNFKGVESRRTPPEGDYPCQVLEATNGVSSNKNDQIEFVAEISKGEYKGVKLYLQCPLLENSLWKLHAFLTALGVDVPEDEIDIDLSELVGEDFMGVITHETYNGKKRAKLTDFDTIDNYSGDADDDDKKGKKGGKKAKAEDDDKKSSKKAGKKDKKEPEKVKKSDVEDMDRDELEELIEEHKLDVDADDKKLKKDDKLLAAVLEALEEEDLLEAEKKSSKKGDDKKASKKDDKKADKKGGKKKSTKLSRSDVEDMDEEELQELLEKHDLEDEVDLDEYKKLPKKVAAVIDALEEADLIEDDD